MTAAGDRKETGQGQPLRQQPSRPGLIRATISEWLLYSVLIPLAPLWVAFIVDPWFESTWGPAMTLSDGTLLLFALVLVSVAYGRLHASVENRTSKTVLLFFFLAILAFSLISFVLIKVVPQNKPASIAELSVITAVGAVFYSLYCALLSSRGGPK